jgi:hypothetical protein
MNEVVARVGVSSCPAMPPVRALPVYVQAGVLRWPMVTLALHDASKENTIRLSRVFFLDKILEKHDFLKSVGHDPVLEQSGW